MIGQAAHVRANHLLAQVAESEREPLVHDLERLQNALSGPSENEQSGNGICNKARPEEPTALPLFAASFSHEIFPLRQSGQPVPQAVPKLSNVTQPST